MKIRNGFVSNSSSSSFIIISTKENFEKVLEKSDKYTKRLVDQLIGNGNLFDSEFLGKKVKVITGFSGMGGECQLDEVSIETEERDEDIDIYELYQKFEDNLTTNTKEVISVSMDN